MTVTLRVITTECPSCGASLILDVDTSAMRAVIKQLRDALEPFSKLTERAGYSFGEIMDSDVERAREALASVGEIND